MDRCEVLVVDGGSVDRSREIVQDRIKQHPSIRLLENPRRVKGVAMNIGIQNARGKYILRMDAHSEYPRDYVQNCLEELERTGADNVGGRWRVVPAKPTFLARALALTVQHPFGVGDAKYLARRCGKARPARARFQRPCTAYPALAVTVPSQVQLRPPQE